MVLESLEPKVVWEIFEFVFSVTPRESKKEEKIRAKLKSWIPERAKSLGLNITLNEDAVGNILVKPETACLIKVYKEGKCSGDTA